MNKQPPPDDFDENPVWTPEMHARARTATEVHGPGIAEAIIRRRGRPKGSRMPDSKLQVTIRVDPDVLAAYKAAGPGWQTRMNDVLRQGLGRKRA